MPLLGPVPLHVRLWLSLRHHRTGCGGRSREGNERGGFLVGVLGGFLFWLMGSRRPGYGGFSFLNGRL